MFDERVRRSDMWSARGIIVDYEDSMKDVKFMAIWTDRSTILSLSYIHHLVRLLSS